MGVFLWDTSRIGGSTSSSKCAMCVKQARQSVGRSVGQLSVVVVVVVVWAKHPLLAHSLLACSLVTHYCKTSRFVRHVCQYIQSHYISILFSDPCDAFAQDKVLAGLLTHNDGRRRALDRCIFVKKPSSSGTFCLFRTLL